MSARFIPAFVPEILPLDKEFFKKRNRKSKQVFVITDKRHGRTAWTDVEELWLPYTLRLEKDKKGGAWHLKKGDITGEMLSLPEVGGWSE